MTLPSVPGPPPMRGVGPVGNMMRYALDPIGHTGRIFRAYGPLAALVKGPANFMTPTGIGVLLANGPELNRAVVTQHDIFWMYALAGRYYPEGETNDRRRPLKRTLTGLFHVNGNEHRRQRRLLMPAFHKTRIDAYRDEMVAITNEVLDGFRPGETRDLWQDMTRITLKIATKTLFGEDAGETGMAVAHMLQEWIVTMMGVGMMLPYDLPGLPYRRWLDLTMTIDQAMAEILRVKKAQKTPGADMLSTLIHARDEDGSALDDDELIGHAGVIFAAGHETSTNALTWTLVLLSQHPQIANDLCDELDAVLHGDAPTIEQLPKLPLLDRVVKESMRVLPPVPLHPRLITEDTELNGFFIPAKTEIMLSIYHTHHMPELFADPEAFLPSRWETIKPSTFEYNPFSAGPRMCIGAAFAMMEIKIALAIFLQRFRIEPTRARRIDRRVAITMAPKAGFYAKICPKDGLWRESAGGIKGDLRELVKLPD